MLLPAVAPDPPAEASGLSLSYCTPCDEPSSGRDGVLDDVGPSARSDLGVVERLVFGLCFGLIFGLCFGLIFGLRFGLSLGLRFGDRARASDRSAHTTSSRPTALDARSER